ncbi:MAG: hypothetical protein ACOCUI_02370, partial [bacterium]
MKICIFGVGRSGTTASYNILQKIINDMYGDDIDFVYEPFLWDRDVFNDMYDRVNNNFKYVNSLNQEGIYNHQKLPMFIDEP